MSIAMGFLVSPRLAQGGLSICSGSETRGTAGICFRNSHDGEYYALTCRHVVEPNHIPLQDLALVTTSGVRIPSAGTVVLPLSYADSPPPAGTFHFDAALLKISSPPERELHILGFDQPICGVDEPSRGDQFHLYSRVLGARVIGEFRDAHEVLWVHSTRAYLTPVFSVDIDAQHGDSGSVLVRYDLKGPIAIGLLVAVDDRAGRNIGVFQPIRAVLARLDAELGRLDISWNIAGGNR